MQRHREIERRHKKEARAKPKPKPALSDLRRIIDGWTLHFDMLAEQMKEVLTPHKQAIRLTDIKLSFDDLRKAVQKMAAWMDELRAEKPKAEPMRTAVPLTIESEFKQLS